MQRWRARLGRNARFSAIGNGLAAAVMGACGYFISPQAVFLVTAALAIPALLALNSIPEAAIDPVRADGGNGTKTEEGRHVGHVGISSLLRKQGLLVFTRASCSSTWRMPQCCRWSAAT